MISRKTLGLALMVMSLAVVGCDDEADPAGLGELPADPEVFSDDFASDVSFQAFDGSKLDAVSVDASVARSGNSSLRVTVPAPGDPSGSYAGGAVVATSPRSFTRYDALTFWARASTPVTLDAVGFGNDNSADSHYTTEVNDLSLSTEWTKFVVPIPFPRMLQEEDGLFFFAEGPEGEEGYDIWFDDIRFESSGVVADPRPVMPSQTLTMEVGSSTDLSDLAVTFDVDGMEMEVGAGPGYFTFFSSNRNVATVSPEGSVTVVGEGMAAITALLSLTRVSGELTVSTSTAPTEDGPTPTQDAANVISLFSDAYDDVTVDTWSAVWDQADLEDTSIGGGAAKLYTNLVFAGIEFTSETIDATAMERFRMDIWTPDPSASSTFKVKLVDFGADGAFDGGDDTEHELSFTATSEPALETGAWVTIDVPLDDFANMTSREHIAQLIISGDPNTVYVDNVMFYRGGPPPTEPLTAAPTPTEDAADVISLFSNAYTDETVDTWSAVWDDADQADVQVDGDDAKLYTNLVFAGIEFTSQPIDATGMDRFRMDIWTPDPSADPAAFKVKLVDFGADGAFDGGDDTEHELSFTAGSTPALRTGTWVTLDVPLDDFAGMTSRGHIAQLIISGDPNTVYVDNVYFYAS
ncbi:MAG: hypothetical protein R3324_06710, partial [Halobacteriales archaeon]|nr:hypothetical protein [Halobacteriales archaeon]